MNYRAVEAAATARSIMPRPMMGRGPRPVQETMTSYS